MSDSLALVRADSAPVVTRVADGAAAPAGPLVDAYHESDDALLTRLVGWFEAAETAEAASRELAERDRNYLDGYQFTPEELAGFKDRKQPPITVNYIRRKIDLMRGLERRSRSDPKAMPRTPSEDGRADAATQALRFVADDVNFPMTRSDAYENMLVEGYGCVEVIVEEGQDGEPEVRCNHVPWDRLFHDPHSRRLDFADAMYLGIVLWMDRDAVIETYPDAGRVVENTAGEAAGSGRYEDRPAVAWCDTKRQRVRVVQMHWKARGDWWQATFAKGGFLASPIRSPYLDRHGRTACPLILQSAYVDRENSRYGVVRDMIGLQDEINKRRSKALHLLSVNRIIYEDGAVDDIDHARREVAKPDGAVKVNGQGMRFDVAPSGDLAQGQFELLRHATAEMQAQGANASLAGKDARGLSGRAIMAQQAGGQAEIEPMTDGLRDLTRRIYEAWWMAVRQFWTGERWVRVMDGDGGVQWMGLNRKVTVADMLAEMPPEQSAVAKQRMGLVPNDPRLAVVVRVENNVSDLQVDITIEEGPDVPTLQAEQFAQITQLAASQPGLIPGDVIIAASNLRNKEALLERMKGMQAQAQAQQQQPNPAQQAMVQAEVRGKNAKAEADEALALQRKHQAVQSVAKVHREAAESPAIPVGPVQPMMLPPEQPTTSAMF